MIAGAVRASINSVLRFTASADGGHGSVAGWHLRYAASRGPMRPRTNLRSAPVGGGRHGPPLTRLRSGAALQGAKPTTTRGVAIRLCPQGRDAEGRVPGTEEDMQQLMTEEIAKTVPRLYGQDGADGPIVQLAARRPSRRAFLLFRDRVFGPILGLSNKISICNI